MKNNSDVIDFRGFKLVKSDAEVIEDIEKTLNVMLKKGVQLGEYLIEGNRITRLNISSLVMKKIPESLKNLTALEELTLDIDEIENFGEIVPYLPSLELLNLCFKDSGSIPPSIGNLTSLRMLYLAGKKLEKLPLSLADMKSLETLGLVIDSPTLIPEILLFPNLLIIYFIGGISKLLYNGFNPDSDTKYILENLVSAGIGLYIP